MSVSTMLGATAFTVMPRPATSRASALVNPRTAERINQEADKLHPRDIYLVRGKVMDDRRRGLSELRVVAVDVNIDRQVPLDEGITGERGVYEIHYSVSGLQKAKPDVQVQVTQDNEILAVSAIRYNAGPVESALQCVIRERYSRLGYRQGGVVVRPRDEVAERAWPRLGDAHAPSFPPPKSGAKCGNWPPQGRRPAIKSPRHQGGGQARRRRPGGPGRHRLRVRLVRPGWTG